jgi:hypothetical protein
MLSLVNDVGRNMAKRVRLSVRLGRTDAIHELKCGRLRV